MRELLFKNLHSKTLIFFGVMVLTTPARAADDDASRITFTDKVKTIRSVAGEYDVFFNEHFGPYSVPYSLPNSKLGDKTPDEFLAAALKSGTPVQVTVNGITETILSIDSDLPRNPASTSTPKLELPPDLESIRHLLEKTSKP